MLVSHNTKLAAYYGATAFSLALLNNVWVTYTYPFFLKRLGRDTRLTHEPPRAASPASIPFTHRRRAAFRKWPMVHHGRDRLWRLERTAHCRAPLVPPLSPRRQLNLSPLSQATNDPIAGWLSDNSRKAKDVWGHRIPHIMRGGWLMPAAFVIAWCARY